MSQINKEKGVYDKIYRIEEIYGMFSEEDRQEVNMILEPVRSLYFTLSSSFQIAITYTNFSMIYFG